MISAARLSPLLLLLALGGCAGHQGVSGTEMHGASAMTILSGFRQQNGLSGMAPDKTLEKAALQQARFMAETGRMTHTTAWGRDFSTRMHQNGVAAPSAENVAYGGMSMAEVFRMWEDSPPHRRNMLDNRFSRFGLASATDAKGKRYWALVLGR